MDHEEERERQERIRKRARQLWEQEGRPTGREDDFVDRATELVAIEDNQNLTTQPLPDQDALGPAGEPIEPIEAVENAGEFPTTTDQDEQVIPSREVEESLADEAPLGRERRS